ncbi:hypothetical protein ACQ4PT_045497 [Festuca glaucescens]
MMTSFTRCSECVVFHNWHLKGDWKKSFIKIVTGDFVDVPRKLANNIRGHICNEVKIEVPNGKSYHVEVSKEDNGLVFKSGWAAFASAYELEQGDILLFESSGGSCFEVRIFNQSCCEKQLSCVSLSNTPCVHERNMSYDNDMQSPQNGRRGDMRSKRMMCKECAALDYWHHKDKMRFFLVMMGVDDLKNGLIIPKNGNSHFKVRIFNGSGCDKFLSCVVKNFTPCVQERINEPCTICLESIRRHYWHMDDHDWCFFKVMWLSNFKEEMAIPKEFTINFRGHVSDEVTLEVLDVPTKRKRQDDSLDHSRKTSKMTPAHSPSQKSNLRLNTEDVTSSEDIQDPRSSGGPQGSTKSPYILVMGCKLTSVQEARVNQLVTESCTGIPFYVTAMNKRSLSDGFQVICKEYAVTHLPHQDQTIKICHPENSKTWDASLKVITDGTCTLSCILTAGWLGFVRDNKLQEGDICALEVLKSDGTVTITVHHLTESPHPEYVATRHTKPTCQQKTKVTKPRYVATKGTKLTREQERKIEERLQDIQPKIEIFVSPIRSYRAGVYFKQSYADDHLPHEDQTMMLRRPGRRHTWRVELHIADKENGKFYELWKGWKKFVNKNKLQEGDLCLFELLKNEGEHTMNAYIIHRD